MRLHAGAIDAMEGPIEVAILFCLGLQGGKDAVPDAGLAPAIGAPGSRFVRAVAPRHLLPGRSIAENQKIPLMTFRCGLLMRPVLGFWGGSSGSSRAYWASVSSPLFIRHIPARNMPAFAETP